MLFKLWKSGNTGANCAVTKISAKNLGISPTIRNFDEKEKTSNIENSYNKI